MAESSTLVALRNNREEIEAQITFLEGRIADLRASLVHVSAVVHLYEAEDGHDAPRPTVSRCTRCSRPASTYRYPWPRCASATCR